MLVMLPAVLLVAYNHGAPGRDRWTKVEKVFVPANAVLAAVLLWSLTPLMNVEAATETLIIEDETGALQEFEVARQGYHHEVVAFYWENETGDPELDWLEYGLPIMLEYDINRVSPVITVDTPLDSELLKERLREQGYDGFTGVPGGLAVELTGERQSDALIVGSFSQSDDSKIVTASIVDAGSGRVLETFSVSADDWMATVDAATAAVLDTWEIAPAPDRSDDPVSEHFSSSLDAVRHFVLAQIAIQINGDYPRGVEELSAALAIDPAFAEALSELSVRQYLSGDQEAAKTRASQALRNSYRLSTSSEFILKANRYIYDGDFDRGERVLDIWTAVEPNSTRALENVAQLARLRGTSASLEKALAAYDRLMQLRPNDYSIYRQKANTKQQRGDYEAAIVLLSRYLEFVPDSGPAYSQLAGLYLVQGDLDAAEAALEDAAILFDNPLSAELGLARLEARRGMPDAAIARLDMLQADELLPQQKMQVGIVNAEIAVAQGRINDAIAMMVDVNELARTLVPPANRIISIETQQAIMLSLLGRFDEALDVADAAAAQLQPPLSLNLNFVYTTIYAMAEDRDEFGRWAQASRDAREQLPQFYDAIMAIEQAQIDIWDGNFEAAVLGLDAAGEMLRQSILQTLLESLGASDMFVKIAELYLEAGAVDKAREKLEAVLLVYPSNAHAKSVLGRVLIASGNVDDARLFLEDAISLWSDADDDFRFLQQARETLASIEPPAGPEA
jgi:tetratricopeptide (TPR) repeat protein